MHQTKILLLPFDLQGRLLDIILHSACCFHLSGIYFAFTDFKYALHSGDSLSLFFLIQ